MPQVATAVEHYSVEGWIHALDAAIVEEVVQSHPFAWDEDHITYSWIARLMRQFAQVHVSGGGPGALISWQAFKAKGPLENKIGDIAVIVQFRYSTEAALTGVGLLEAKRINEAGNEYSAIKWPQLITEIEGRSNHRVLFYDFSAVDIDSSLAAQLLEPLEFRQVHAVTAPTVHILAQRSKARSVAEAGLPLAYQIGARYLRGYDLEYDDALVKSVAAAQPSRVRYVIVAQVDQRQDPTTSGQPVPLNPTGFDRIVPEQLQKAEPAIGVETTAAAPSLGVRSRA